MKTVKVEWPSGLTEVLDNVPADKLYRIVEGQGIQLTTALSEPGGSHLREKP
jgi:hypothetical protein